MPVHGYMITLLESFYDFTWRTTPSLNELFEIKNELKKLTIKSINMTFQQLFFMEI